VRQVCLGGPGNGHAVRLIKLAEPGVLGGQNRRQISLGG
jgi:hypothetical protein